MIKPKYFAALMLFTAASAQADLEIRSLADSPRHAAALQRLQAASARQPAPEAGFPSLKQIIAGMQTGRIMAGLAGQAPTYQSPSRPAIEQLGCHLAGEAPSGVERKAGGLNGVMSVYACGSKYVVTYEYDYSVALTQRVVVVDDDFAQHTDPRTPLIKTRVVTRGETRLTAMRWLNPRNEIRYEVYAEHSQAADETLEKSLESVLGATALAWSR